MTALEVASLRRRAGRARRQLRLERDAAVSRLQRSDLAIFHEFESPPSGGGHQALRALVVECLRRGVRVSHNSITPTTRACLFNSFNFDLDRLERLRSLSRGCRMVHRVGAVTSLYRGWDDGTDARVAEINRTHADATLAISRATVRMYREIGVELVDPHVVYNPTDSRIFHPDGRIAWNPNRKTRLICSSWSDNPRKGTPTYRWLEQQLDWNRFEFTFVGNTEISFDRIRHVQPLPSEQLAGLLREHDIFVTATENDAYSNGLVEALSCGLPAVYLDSGGSAEAVKDAGFGYRERGELPGLLDRLVDEYEDRQAAISLPSLEEVVDDYLRLLGLVEFVSSGR